MKKTIKFMSGVLALAMCFSVMPMSAFADQVEDQTLTTNDTASVEVTISTASQYEVKIPKKLTLTVPATQNAEIPYTYMVKGSIAGNEQVKVVPDATVTMKQEGKEDNEGTITQDKQVWSCADFEALNGSNAAEIVWSEETPGDILVENMSAGTWNGAFNFNITLETFSNQVFTNLNSTSGFYDSNGLLQDNAGIWHTEFVPVKNGSTYIVGGSIWNIPAVLFDENKEFVEAIELSEKQDNIERYITINNPAAKYMVVNHMKGDDGAIYIREVAPNSSQSFKGKIGLLGDSITVGISMESGGVTSLMNYGALLGQEINMDVRNYAISGSYIAHTNQNNTISNKISKMDSDLDVICIMAGINDYYSGSVEFGSTDDNTIDTFCGSLNVLLTSLQNQYSNKKIIVMTPLVCKKSLDGEVNATTGKTLKEYVDAEKEIAAKYSDITVIDTYTWSLENLNPSSVAEFTDGIHPNISTHLSIAEFVNAEFSRLGIA